MDLYIRSQNKNKLYKCDEIDLEKEAFKDWCIETKIGRDYVVKDSWSIYVNNKLFGRYFNEERALEVLDEIQKLLMPISEYKQEIDNLTINYKNIDTAIYEMPKD